MMHARPERLPDPVGRRYIAVGFDGSDPITFRRPGLEDYTKILGRWERMVAEYVALSRRLADLAARIKDATDDDAEPLLAEAQALAEQMPAAQVAMAAGAGFLIGQMWADPAQTLDAVERWAQAVADPKGAPYPVREGLEPWMSYGLDVYAEMCDVIDPPEVLDLAGTLHKQTSAWMSPNTDTEVRRKAKVFPRT